MEYTEEVGLAICEAVAGSDKGLRRLLEDEGLPSITVVRRWLNQYAHFSAMYANAKRTQIENMAEDIIDLANDNEMDPNDKRIRIDARKWLLSKLMHKTYGDKLDVTSNGETLSTPPHLIDARVQSIIMQARARRQAGPVVDLSPDALKLLD